MTTPKTNEDQRRAPLEIERKYLLGGIPAIPQVAGAETWKVEQGYLDSPTKGEDSKPFSSGRLRKTILPLGSVLYFHSIKSGAGMVRQEWETEITREQFDQFWPRTQGRRLRKTRHRVPEGALIWEIDVFEGIDLALAEIELPSPDTPFTIPEWLEPHIVREVTDDPAFTNAAIARRLGEGGKRRD